MPVEQLSQGCQDAVSHHGATKRLPILPLHLAVLDLVEQVRDVTALDLIDRGSAQARVHVGPELPLDLIG